MEKINFDRFGGHDFNFFKKLVNQICPNSIIRGNELCAGDENLNS